MSFTITGLIPNGGIGTMPERTMTLDDVNARADEYYQSGDEVGEFLESIDHTQLDDEALGFVIERIELLISMYESGQSLLVDLLPAEELAQRETVFREHLARFTLEQETRNANIN